MLTRSEIDRSAAAIHNLRPDWPTKSLATFIGTDMATMAYADVVTALTIVAVDPKTQTPRRVLEAGPWWTAVQAAFGGGSHGTVIPGPSNERCTVEGHEHELAGHCRSCAADAKGADGWLEPDPSSPQHVADYHAGMARARAALAQARRHRRTDEPYTDAQMSAAGDTD